MDASPSLDIEPILAERIDDVRLVRDENVVLARLGCGGQHVAQRLCSTVVLVRRNHQSTFGQIGGRLDVLEAGQYCGLVGAIELAGVQPLRPARPLNGSLSPKARASSLPLSLRLRCLVMSLRLNGSVSALVAEGRAVPHETRHIHRARNAWPTSLLLADCAKAAAGAEGQKR